MEEEVNIINWVNGKIMFEAEYLNGEITRKIKEYHDYYK